MPGLARPRCRAALAGGCSAPHVATFRRVLKITDANPVDTVIGLFLAGLAGCGGLAGGAARHQEEGREQEEHGPLRRADSGLYPARHRRATSRTSARGGFLLLVGDSTAGKTRSAYHAMTAVVSDHVLIAPHSRSALPASQRPASTQSGCYGWITSNATSVPMA